jgi:hypothetical protein
MTHVTHYKRMPLVGLTLGILALAARWRTPSASYS